MSLGRIFSLVLIGVLSLGDTVALARQARVAEIEAARRAYWEGKFEAAIGELEPLLGKLKDPKALWEASFLLGLSYLALREESKGKDYFKQAIVHDPSFTPSRDIYPPNVTESYESVRAETTGKIVVSSDPPGAIVHIGERSVGKTPYTGDASTGEHTVRVELEGYSGQARKVRVAAGKTQTITFKLGREVAPEPSESSEEARSVEEFQRIWLLVQDGDTTKERDAILRLEDNRLVVLSEKARYEMKTISYRDIRAAEYSYSKHPRWKEGLGAALAVGVSATPIFFLTGKKHWLTVQTEDDYAIIRLDKKNYETVCLSFEAASGYRIEHLGEK